MELGRAQGAETGGRGSSAATAWGKPLFSREGEGLILAGAFGRRPAKSRRRSNVDSCGIFVQTRQVRLRDIKILAVGEPFEGIFRILGLCHKWPLFLLSDFRWVPEFQGEVFAGAPREKNRFTLDSIQALPVLLGISQSLRFKTVGLKRYPVPPALFPFRIGPAPVNTPRSHRIWSSRATPISARVAASCAIARRCISKTLGSDTRKITAISA